ncbi:MAG: peptidoglycan-binding domain-containing protein [Myxococcota bacterium]
MHRVTSSAPTLQTAQSSQSSQVAQLQRALSRALGVPIRPSGVVDAATERALRAFQQRERLPETGAANAATLAALAQSSASVPSGSAAAALNAVFVQITVSVAETIARVRPGGVATNAQPAAPAEDASGPAPSEDLRSGAQRLLAGGSRAVAALIDERLAEFGVPEGGFPGQGSVYLRRGPRAFFTLRAVERNARATERNFRRASRVFDDPGLLMAVLSREHPSGLWAASARPVDTWSFGGLDHLGSQLGRIRNVPRRRWEALAERQETENGVTRDVRPARIPARDQILAYAGVLQLAERRFESHVRDVFGERADAMLEQMSSSARRTWIAYTFARPNIKTDGRVPADRNFSSHNALRLLESQGVERLNAILESPELAANRSVRIARQRALEASIFEGVIPDAPAEASSRPR